MARVNMNQLRKVQMGTTLALRHHQKTVGRIYDGARFLVPRGDHRSGSGERRPGKTLAQSLKTVARHRPPFLLSTLIGSDKRYAASEHQGSRAHFIRRRGKMLKFQWERGSLLLERRGKGRRTFFYFKSVHHPGNKRPVRYLTTPMHLYGRLYGYRTSAQSVNRSRLP